jgi:ABC-type branched-subunit amino acid transport system ATPase component
VTEERSIFRGMTTAQNLHLGRGDVDMALKLVPELRVFSGGEQQMLTLARARAAQPRILLADELSIGLAPLIVRRLFGCRASGCRQRPGGPTCRATTARRGCPTAIERTCSAEGKS